VGEAPGYMPDKLVCKLYEPFPRTASVDNFTCKDKERYGKKGKSLHAGGHPLHHHYNRSSCYENQGKYTA
jgi:hypothetical protein